MSASFLIYSIDEDIEEIDCETCNIPRECVGALREELTSFEGLAISENAGTDILNVGREELMELRRLEVLLCLGRIQDGPRNLSEFRG
jgi:hypothetical protein